MLARKYDYTATAAPWAAAPQTAPQTAPEPRHRERPYVVPGDRIERTRRAVRRHDRLLVRRILVAAILVFGIYTLLVIRNGVLTSSGFQLEALQARETQLLAKNAELKIEVDGLKGPERITSFAEKQLGMSVARSNIYVKVK